MLASEDRRGCGLLPAVGAEAASLSLARSSSAFFSAACASPYAFQSGGFADSAFCESSYARWARSSAEVSAEELSGGVTWPGGSFDVC